MKLREKIKNLYPYQKNLLRVGCVLLALFLVYNLGWAIWREVRYGDFKKAVGYSEEYQSWSVWQNDWLYSVFPAGYLRFNGNLSTANEQGEGLVIWPQPAGGYKYAAIIKSGTSMQNGVVGPQLTVIAMDENCNWTDEGNAGYGEAEKALLRERKADVEAWLAAANEMWDLS